MTMQHHLHVEASFQTLLDILEQTDARETAKQALKQAGIVAGGVLVGTLAMGPFGLIAGAGMAGSAAAHVKPHGKEYDAMLDFLRSMSFDHKAALIVDVEGLVESTNIDMLVKFAKPKPNKDKLVNLVTNFLVDNLNFQNQDKTEGSQRKVYDGQGRFNELEDLMNQEGN